MAIFAPKCDRCGQRTRHEEKGRPLCEDCMQKMQLMLDAANENVHLCPVDSAAMQKEIAHMIVIDKCPQCNGVWLDGGELNKLTHDVQADAIMAVTRGYTIGMP